MDDDDVGHSEDAVPVASFLPTAANVDAVQRALDEAGVAFWMEGSRVYEVRVRPSDVDRAVDALGSCDAAPDVTIYPGPGDASPSG